MSISYTEQTTTIPLIHLEIVRDQNIKYSTVQVQTPTEVADLFQSIIGKRNTEVMLVCGVDVKKNPVFLQIVSIGTLDTCQISVPEIWKAAMLCNAAEIIIAHNHPSGNHKPSEADIQLTKRLIYAGSILGIPLLDHLIVTEEGFYSFRENQSELWTCENIDGSKVR